MSRGDSPEMLVLKDVEHELGCRPDGGVAAARALKARVAVLQRVVDELRPRSPSQRSEQLDRLIARVAELDELIQDNVPLPWCLKCKMECELVDDRMCCLVCETEVISPTSEHVARVAELVESEEKAWQTVAKLRIDLETTDRLRINVAELEAKSVRHAEEIDEWKEASGIVTGSGDPADVTPMMAANYWHDIDLELTKSQVSVAELEEERATIMGISQDCDGTATDPVEAFNDLLRAFEVAVTDRAELGRELNRLRQSGKGESDDG